MRLNETPEAGNSGASRIAPRSPRAALEPERMSQPSRPSRRARHPVVIVGNAVITIVLLAALVTGLGLVVGKNRFEAPGPLEADRVVNIPAKLGIKDIAELLQREGVIDQPWLFMSGVRAPPARDQFHYGEYLRHRQATRRDLVTTAA